MWSGASDRVGNLPPGRAKKKKISSFLPSPRVPVAYGRPATYRTRSARGGTMQFRRKSGETLRRSRKKEREPRGNKRANSEGTTKQTSGDVKDGDAGLGLALARVRSLFTPRRDSNQHMCSPHTKSLSSTRSSVRRKLPCDASSDCLCWSVRGARATSAFRAPLGDRCPCRVSSGCARWSVLARLFTRLRGRRRRLTLRSDGVHPSSTDRARFRRQSP